MGDELGTAIKEGADRNFFLRVLLGANWLKLVGKYMLKKRRAEKSLEFNHWDGLTFFVN